MNFGKKVFTLTVHGDKDMNLRTEVEIDVPTQLLPLVVFGMYKCIEEITEKYDEDGINNMEIAIEEVTNMFNKKYEPPRPSFKFPTLQHDKEH